MRDLKSGVKASEIVRSAPVISSEQKQEYIRNYEQIANRKYEVMKMKPKICELVDMAQRQELSTSDFPYVGPAPPREASRDAQSLKKKGTEIDPAKRMIVFVAGGICRTELSALQAYEKEHNEDLHNYVLGSTEVFTAKQFMSVLADTNAVSASDVRINAEGDEDSDVDTY